MTAPILEMHHGIAVVRDDLFPGGTKARFIAQVFDGVQEAVYASPPEGGAQTAIATVARRLGKRATIFVAARARPHPRTLEAARLGAKVVPISPGYLSVVQSRAREYCRNTGASLIPFGAEIPGAVEAIASAARMAALEPEEVWCAAGSGVLARGLAAAWPKARRHVVQIGRDLTIWCPAAGSSIWLRAVNELTGAVFEQEVTTDLPQAATFLAPRLFLNNGATAAAVAFECTGLYLETDF